MTRERCRKTKNGIEIYSYENPSLSSVYISLFVRAGSMYESESDSGITHFLEHAVIRNVNHGMGGGLYSTLDKLGMEFNASTFSEMVQFYVMGGKSSFKTAADIIRRIFSPITLPTDEIRAECRRIKAEIREGDDKNSLSSFTSGIVFDGTTLSRPITGTVGGVSRITRSRLEAYRRSIFTRDNLFLYVTGSVSDEELDYLEGILLDVELYEGEAHRNVAPVPKAFFKRDGRVLRKNGDFTMMRFTFDIDMSRVTVPETDLIYDILMSGYNSRFFIEMSERRGLFYDISGSTERYLNIGTVSFSFELRPDAICEALEITLSILGEMKTKLLPPDECMKAGYVDNAMLLYDDSRELNFTLAYDNHLMNSGYETLTSRAEAYRRVTPEDIRRASNEIFRRENLTVTLKGKKKDIDTEKLEEIIRNFN